jgi:hypothetical protein
MTSRTTAISDIHGCPAALDAIRPRFDVLPPGPLVEPQGITGDLGHRAEEPMPLWTGWGLVKGRGFRLAPCGRPGHDLWLQIPSHQADSFP